ncbi:DUF3247 family protein [Luteibacter aegosomatis]|uniref:DUF3247 family protein n=1 Tax=Luteibacter aegosomatis TaxID=2911537 RepID=UPI001FFB38C6|nr:DUF3247 family protein [Luteibacter aegosomatis]UPG84353.1 DUF3247 family protein [Luteibacter aegosomatis]
MAQNAKTVFTHPDDMARLDRLVAELAVNARVRVHLVGGGSVEGTVAVTPTVQSFRDEEGTEGTNGVVRLEKPDATVWLGDMARVEHLDSVVKGSSRA